MTDATPVPPDLIAHAAFVRRLSRSLLLDLHAAEDVEQETWRAAIERPPARGGDLRGWLARVTRNFARRWRRSAVRRIDREQTVARPEAVPSSEASLIREEALQRVVDAVRALEEPYRTTILARFYEELPPRDIAARERVPVDTVNTRLKRALAQLRSRLEREERDWRGALGLLAGESPCLPGLEGGAGPLIALMKFKTVIVAVLALLVSWGLWRAIPPRGDPREAAVGSAVTAEARAEPPIPSSPDDHQPRLAILVPQPALSGRVIDEQGQPVREARVCVLGDEDPFGGELDPSGIAWNHHYGRAFACDGEGHWRALLPAPARVLVTVETDEVLELVGPGGERWVDAPAAGIDFVVRRIPTATLEVRVFEGADRRPLEEFSVLLYGSTSALPDGGVRYEGGYYGAAAEGGIAQCVLGIRDPGGRRMQVVLTSPDLRGLWARLGRAAGHQPEQEVLLLPGKTEEVIFVLPEREVVRGIVVDEQGTPIPDALVFFGEETRARGDEPFKTLRGERITDGARTAADGWFELRGEGEEVTAVHANSSGTTVKTEQAGRIVLGARGVIRGRLLDAAGLPSIGALVRLDCPWDGGQNAAQATTDVGGWFRFEDVEAGAHALWVVEDEVLQCVRVARGEEVEVELRLDGATLLELDIAALSPEEQAELEGVLVGLDQVFGVCWIQEGIIQGNALPGRYWLTMNNGICAPITVVEGEYRVRVEPGGATLVVRSEERQNVQIVPSDADPFTRLVAARAWVMAVGETEASFRLHPGHYLVIGEGGKILREVEVPLEGLELVLD